MREREVSGDRQPPSKRARAHALRVCEHPQGRAVADKGGGRRARGSLRWPTKRHLWQHGARPVAEGVSAARLTCQGLSCIAGVNLSTVVAVASSPTRF